MSALYVRRRLGRGASLETVRRLVGLPRPTSTRQLIETYSQPVVLDEPLITGTGVALGGHQKVTLRIDGSWQWDGHFRATGLWSYDVSLATNILAGDGSVLLLSTRGSVFGSNEPGDRVHAWSQQGSSPVLARLWPDLRHARLEHNLQYDVDLFGSAGSILGFLGKAFLAGATVGTSGLLVALSTEVIDALDLEDISLPGMAGLIAAGGVLLVLGPFGLVPATIAGVAVGRWVQSELNVGRLEEHEYAYFDDVFGGRLPPREKIVVTNLLGLDGRAFAWPGPGGVIWVNIGEAVHDPMGHRGKGRKEDAGKILNAPGQMVVHELTHAWQIHHTDAIPTWMCSGLYNQARHSLGGGDVYKYATADQNWTDFNAEQQASIVADWYGGDIPPNNVIENGRYVNSPQGKYPARSMANPGEEGYNPYWPLVRDNIRQGVN